MVKVIERKGMGLTISTNLKERSINLMKMAQKDTNSTTIMLTLLLPTPLYNNSPHPQSTHSPQTPTRTRFLIVNFRVPQNNCRSPQRTTSHTISEKSKTTPRNCHRSGKSAGIGSVRMRLLILMG